ncbi:MAG: NAD(P)H-hydrate dehydratase [Corticimicrobacter sp.]|uniref:NAD(P)H-hydrate dehydratase n=1 Tax=Corticimicrobacter sp. TaxID=2678536 RepID=UPI0032DBCCF3
MSSLPALIASARQPVPVQDGLSLFPALFAPRAALSHKGSHGSLAVLGGAAGMSGAVLLAARAALFMGTGKVFAGFCQAASPLPCDPQHPELMLHAADALLEAAGSLDISAWTAGCGLGRSDMAERLLHQLLGSQPMQPIVLDADGLRWLAEPAHRPFWRSCLTQAGAPRVLTPHPGEAATLLDTDIAGIQADRPRAVMHLAQRYDCWAVLKGAGTLVCAPDGRLWQNGSGNPGLASGGTGDVLAGMIGSFLAQGIPPEQAIPGAVWLHGAAADYLVAHGTGPKGMTASEVILAARTLLNRRPA